MARAGIQLLNSGAGLDLTPYHASDVAIINLPAKLLKFSGIVGSTREGKTPSDFAEQARLAFSNLKAALHAAGASVRHVTHIRIYCSRWDEGATAIWKPMEEFCTDSEGIWRPTNAIVMVQALGAPEWKLEILADAAIPSTQSAL